jgi:D-glycero-D-manno-heptose 1,7-bisphosphate phosphatase
MPAAIFLDRDGTLIEEVHYLSRVEDLRFLPGVPEALRSLQAAGFALVLLTNQSGVARGLLTEETLQELHAALTDRLASAGVRLDALHYCPHHPDYGPPHYRRSCTCRKPATGMMEAATARLRLDLSASWAVGDKWSDLEGPLRMGCRAILVRTGHGREQEALRAEAPVGVQVAEDLPEAARRILEGTPPLTTSGRTLP